MYYKEKPLKPCPPNNPHCQPTLPIDDFIAPMMLIITVYAIYKIFKNLKN